MIKLLFGHGVDQALVELTLAEAKRLRDRLNILIAKALPNDRTNPAHAALAVERSRTG